MGNDILNGLSTNELSKEIQRLICEDQRSLPPRSKVFSAVAKLQKFDVLPEVGDIDDLNKSIADGCLELNRGLAAGKGVPSHFYARELIFGAYPGTLVALGNGMYFSVPSKSESVFGPAFRLVSVVALKYTVGESSGSLIRAALKKNAKIAECDELKQYLRENRNRAKRAGITDIGAFAAALGFDAIFADGMYDDTDERVTRS